MTVRNRELRRESAAHPGRDHRLGSWPTLTCSVSLRPRRTTVSGILVPGLIFTSTVASSSAFAIASPPTAAIRSPARTPAAAAGGLRAAGAPPRRCRGPAVLDGRDDDAAVERGGDAHAEEGAAGPRDPA